MTFPDSVDDRLLVDGLNMRTQEDYTLEAVNGAEINLIGSIKINGDPAAHLSDLPFVDSRDYDLVGDGVADDTVGLQAFLNAYPTKHHYLRNPSVKYRITSTLTIPDSPGYHLQGESRRSTIIELDASNTPILNRLGQYQHSDLYEHFCLRYKVDQSTAQTSSVAFQLDCGDVSYGGGFYLTWRHILISGSYRGIFVKTYATKVQNYWNCTFEEIDFDNMSGTLIGLRSATAWGMPVNYFKMIRILNQGATYLNDPLEAAIVCDGEVVIDCLDIEDWRGYIFLNFYGQATIRGIHIERHTVVEGNRLFELLGNTYDIEELIVDYAAASGGSYVFWMGAEAKINLKSGGHLSSHNAAPGGSISLFNLGATTKVNMPFAVTHTGNATYYSPVFPWIATPLMPTWKTSVTWDPASVANGSFISTTVAFPNAVIGDTVVPSFSLAVPAGVLLVASVTAADVVTVTMMNHSGGAVDLASGTLSVRIWKTL